MHLSISPLRVRRHAQGGADVQLQGLGEEMNWGTKVVVHGQAARATIAAKPRGARKPICIVVAVTVGVSLA